MGEGYGGGGVGCLNDPADGLVVDGSGTAGV